MNSTFLFDGSGTVGEVDSNPNAAGVFYFTLKLMYGDYLYEVQPSHVNASVPTQLPPLPKDIPVSATVHRTDDGGVTAMKLVSKDDLFEDGSALGANYTFVIPTLDADGEYEVVWETPLIYVSCGSDLIRLDAMTGTSEVVGTIGPSMVTTIDPANYNNSTQNTGYINTANFSECMFIVTCGALDSTVDFRVRAAADTGGTGEVNVTDAVITQLTASNDNKTCVVNVKTASLPDGKPYVRGRLTVGNGTTNIVSVVGLGFTGTYTNADSNGANVLEVVTV